MKVSTVNNLEIAIMEPKGAIIGGDETDELKQEARNLFEQGNRKLILDLSHVDYLNSSGIGAIVSIHTMYARESGRITLCGLGKGVKNVFVITSLTRIIDVEETREDAINKMK